MGGERGVVLVLVWVGGGLWLRGRLRAELVRIAYRLSASTLPGFPDIWAPELVYAWQGALFGVALGSVKQHEVQVWHETILRPCRHNDLPRRLP